MGVDPAYRQYLMAVLRARKAPRDCFFAALPAHARARPFDVVVIDLMQELAVIKGAAALQMTGEDIQRRIVAAIDGHLSGSDRDDPVCTAAHLVVGCLDNMHQVPRNKAFVESGRDSDKAGSSAESIIMSTAAEYEALLATCARLASEAARERHRYTKTMAETDAAEAHAHAQFSDERDFLITRGPIPTSGAKIWRNAALSWQLKRLVTEAVCAMPVPPEKHVLLDEGLPLNSKQYGPLRARMLSDHGPVSSIPPHERAALVGHLMKGCLRRIVLEHGGRGKQLPVTGLGESDHKILYYVQRRAPLGLRVPLQNRPPGERRVRYLIKCQDTDVMWQMLAHMRTLINPETGDVDEVDVWFDTQTPTDRAKGESREYRFIDAVELWRQTHDWLREAFPALKNPLEALLFTVFCNNNDYVERFPAHMQIGPVTVWNTLMELFALGSGKPAYPSSSGKPAPVTKTDPARWRLAMRVNTFTVATERATDHGLAQLAGHVHLVEGGSVALHVYDTPIHVVAKTGVDVLYALVQRSKSLRALVAKHGEPANPLKTGNLVENAHELLETVAQLHAREMSALIGAADADTAKSTIAPMLDVPLVPAMEARLARIVWTVNCYVNGWKSTAYTYNWFDHNGEYSRHGWRAVDVTGTPHGAPNSQYLYADYHPPVWPERPEDEYDKVNGFYRYLRPELCHEVVKSAY
jgi:hypothetical protein